MKILVTGTKGQLGNDVMAEAAKRGIEAVGVDIEQMDITDEAKVHSVIENGGFDAVVHCAAWTAVDKAEEPELYDTVRAVNALGVKYIRDACQAQDIPLMFFSTDYVFDGQGTRPWKEDDPYHPMNVYGKTKAEGESYVKEYPKSWIIRISWVFGKNGSNFIKTMLKLAQNHTDLNVVNDQIGMVTYTKDLAVLVLDMIQSDRYGIYHASNSGDYISWYDFACEIFNQAGLDVKVHPCTSAEFPAKAARPANSRMDLCALERNGFKPLPHWKDALARYLKEIEAI